jgi:DNA-binding IclR family transcriptional regulator
MRDENKVLLLKTWRPQGVSSVWMEVGYKFPILGSSSGQALMAAYSDQEFVDLCEKIDANGSELERIRNEGYSQLLTQGFVVDMNNRFTSKINAVSAIFRSQEFGEPMVFTCGGVPELLTEELMRSKVGPSLHAAVRKLNKVTGRPEALVVRG